MEWDYTITGAGGREIAVISDFPYFSPNFSNIISIRLSLLMLISGALLRINRQDEHKHIKHIFLGTLPENI